MGVPCITQSLREQLWKKKSNEEGNGLKTKKRHLKFSKGRDKKGASSPKPARSTGEVADYLEHKGDTQKNGSLIAEEGWKVSKTLFQVQTRERTMQLQPWLRNKEFSSNLDKGTVERLKEGDQFKP